MAGGLELAEARIQGSFAGMEPPPGARRRDGFWNYRPRLPVLEKLALARSDQGGDYRLCWGGRCTALARILPQASDRAEIEFFPCPAGDPATR